MNGRYKRTCACFTCCFEAGTFGFRRGLLGSGDGGGAPLFPTSIRAACPCVFRLHTLSLSHTSAARPSVNNERLVATSFAEPALWG